MKQVVAIALMGLVMLLVSQATLTSIHFYWNQAQLAEEHCINKARPQLQCEGKCYLKKMLEDQQTEDHVPSKTDQEILPFYGLPLASTVLSVPVLASTAWTARAPLGYMAADYEFDYQQVLVPPPEMRLNENS